MDFKRIKVRAIEYLSKAKTVVKDAWSLPYARLYFALSLVLVPVFVFFTFPYEVLIRNQLQKLESTMGRNIQIGNIDFSVIGDTYIDLLSLTLSGGAELTFKDIVLDLSINPYTLLLRRNIRGGLGIGSFKYAKNEAAFNNTLKSSFNIRLDDKTGMPKDGNLSIDLTNVSIKGITIKGFDIPPVRLTTVKGAASLRNRRLRIENLVFSGNDVRGEIKGSLTIEPMAAASRLNLYVYIHSDSRILQEYKMLLDTFVKDDGGKIKIEIGGSFANPNVKFPFRAGEDGEAPPRTGPRSDSTDAPRAEPEPEPDT